MSEVEIRPSLDPFEQRVPENYQFLKLDCRHLRLVFHHPGYSPDDDELFFLYAWDRAEGGLHYGLAHNACAIIADNRHDGWLTATRDGPRIKAGLDDILPAGDYWFHVPHPVDATAKVIPNEDALEYIEQTRDPYRWPVVTCFQDWKFPRILPPVWTRIRNGGYPARVASQSQFAPAIRVRDVTCRISNHHTGTEIAHLCPRHETNWFLSNTMSRYNVNSSLDPSNLMNDHTNAILLRSDLHLAFDERQFAFFPKDACGYTVHMLEPTLDIGPLYHNTLLRSVTDCAVQFFYARFAWAIFPSLAAFLSKPGVKRIVISVRNDGDGTMREVVEITDKTDLKVSASASRSSSPKKRSRAEYFKDDGDFQADDDQNEQLGRKRRRSLSYITFSTRQNASATTSFSATADDLPAAMTLSLRLPSKEDAELKDTSNSLDSPIPLALEYPGQKDIQKLKQDALAKQRPPGFKPPTFHGRMPAREGLELMGVEIIDDEEDDLGRLDWPDR